MISTKEAFIDAKEVSRILGIGMTKAYAVIKAYNAELDAQGYYTMRGKCPRKYFEQKIYGYADYYNPDDDLTRKAGMAAEKCHCQAKEKVQSGQERTLVAKPKLRYVSRKYIIAKGFGSCNQKVRQRDKIPRLSEESHFDWKNK